tara:strand:+ start:278 stop:613 length:336 start_codon:yes stop_codon:yes gene_type:complete
MNEEREYQENRIPYQQARKALRLANPKRQYATGSVDRFRTKASAIVDLFAKYVDEQMIKSPNTGHGCRVNTSHVNISFMKLSDELEDFFKKEAELMASVRIAMNVNGDEEE